MISSTRKKRKRTGNLDNPVEYLAGIVVGRLPKQEIKRDQPHNPIWKKPTPDGIMKYVGYREIINKAFLDGFYDKQIVQSESGQFYLNLVSMCDKPYSIFSKEIQQKRKRHRQNQEGSNSSQTVKISEQSAKRSQDAAPTTNGKILLTPPSNAAAANTPPTIFAADTASTGTASNTEKGTSSTSNNQVVKSKNNQAASQERTGV